MNWINQAGVPEALVMLTDGKFPSTSVACVAAFFPDKNVVAYMGTKTEFKTLQGAIDSIHDWHQNIKTLLVPFRLTTEQLFMKQASEKTHFVGVGRLCYDDNQTQALRVDISAEDEAKIFNSRLIGLVMRPKNWAEHHHLAGTTDRAKKGIKGNYTALVSELPMVS